MLSAFGYTSNIASGIFASQCVGSTSAVCSDELVYLVVVVTASLLGISASTIWLAQGSYINAISSKCPSKKGTLFGMFWSIN